MRKLKVYVETSVWGMLANDEPAVWREATDSFFARSEEYDLYISPLVLEEVYNAHDAVKDTIVSMIREVRPEVLAEYEQIGTLASEYIAKSAFTEKQRYDATHVAYASFHGINILISYNYKHIVRYEVRRIVTSINIMDGYSTPEIISPLQL